MILIDTFSRFIMEQSGTNDNCLKTKHLHKEKNKKVNGTNYVYLGTISFYLGTIVLFYKKLYFVPDLFHLVPPLFQDKKLSRWNKKTLL